jgi:DNA-binding response OmpR family regulator
LLTDTSLYDQNIDNVTSVGSRRHMELEHILVVDDEVSIRLLVTTVLEMEGYIVYAVGDGRSALTAIYAYQPKLVLLDIGMPVLTGDRVLQQLRFDNVTVPVIIMTAGPVKASWHGQGVIAVLAKPFEIDALVNLVRSMLSREHETPAQSAA